MSNAGRETKWISRSTRCASQIRPPVQRRTTSPGGRTAWLPHTGQTSGNIDTACALRPPLGHHRNDLRDHVAGALQHDRVADADVLARDLVLVVQRRILHQHAADIHRLQPRHRRQRAGAADLDSDVLQHRHRLLGRELPRDRPARRAPDEPKPRLQRQVVDLVDHAIDVIAEAGALGRDLGLEIRRLLLAFQMARQRVDLETPLAQPLQIVPVRIGDRFARLALRIRKQRQRPSAVICGSSCRRLPAAALRGLANTFCPAGGLRLVHREEVGLGHEDFAADFDQRRRAAFQPLRHRRPWCAGWR